MSIIGFVFDAALVVGLLIWSSLTLFGLCVGEYRGACTCAIVTIIFAHLVAA